MTTCHGSFCKTMLFMVNWRFSPPINPCMFLFREVKLVGPVYFFGNHRAVGDAAQCTPFAISSRPRPKCRGPRSRPEKTSGPTSPAARYSDGKCAFLQCFSSEKIFLVFLTPLYHDAQIQNRGSWSWCAGVTVWSLRADSGSMSVSLVCFCHGPIFVRTLSVLNYS